MTGTTMSPPAAPAVSRTRHGGGFVGLAWLTWRQHRWLIVAGVLGFGLLTAYLLWLDQEIGRLAAPCGGPCTFASTPRELVQATSRADTLLNTLMFAGPVVAAFLAAPLVSREYERRTNLLVWSQDVRATYWFAVKAFLLVAVVAVLSAVLGFVASNLAHLLYVIRDPRISYPNLFVGHFFEATPAMQVGYTLFGFALGLAVSAVVRRTVPAMGITLAVFIATRLLVYRERAYFMPLLRHLDPVQQPSAAMLSGARKPIVEIYGDNALLVNFGYADAAGNSVPVTDRFCLVNVKPGPSMGELMQACLRDHGAVNRYVDYQPGSRIGTFHLIEEGIFLGLAAVLFVLAWWRVRRATTVG
jgi:hypothetical protein